MIEYEKRKEGLLLMTIQKNITIKKIICFLSTAILLVSWLTSSLTAYASSEQPLRDISDSAVTTLTVTPEQINDGGNVKVRVEFDEERENIQSGDIITVSWPTQGEAYFNGYIKNIPLNIQGKYVGDAVITNDQATITFNESINNLDDVKGWLEFELQGRNLTDTSREDTKTVTITSGGVYADVKITKPEAGTNSVFYYKTGDMLPNDTEHVRWFLQINNDKKYVEKPIHILDSIQGGQELDPNSFDITVEGQHPNHFKGSNAIEEFKNTFSGATISYSGNEITVDIPESWASLNFFSIQYRTKITNPNQGWFVNKTKAWFKEYGKSEVSGESFDYSVKNINADAGITGTIKGELKIIKKLKEKDIPIEGVNFILKRTDGLPIQEGKTELVLKTDSNGVANIKGLPVGEYLVKEAGAPEWIAYDPINSPEMTFTVSDEDTEGKVWNVENELKKTSIPVEKSWIGHAGEQVEIKLLADGTEVDNVILNVKNGWKHVFTDKPEYDVNTKQKIVYTVSETHIDGYESKITDFRNNPNTLGEAGNLQGGFKVENYEKPDLAIKKEVTGESGDKTKQFTFDILLKQYDEKKLAPINGEFKGILSTIDNPQGEETKITFVDGKATISLSHGQQIVLKDLPYGTKYEVTEREANTDNYITTYDSKRTTSATGELKSDKQIKVENNKEFVPATGISNTTEYDSLIGSIVGILGLFVAAMFLYSHKVWKR